MRKFMMMGIAGAMALSAAGGAFAQKADTSKMTAPSQTPGPAPRTEPFGGATATAGASAQTNAPPYQPGDDKKPVTCHDKNGHKASCSKAGTKPDT